MLPLLGALDVLLLRSGRSAWFWIRACGFERSGGRYFWIDQT
jgi:hypothetical protein